VDRAPQANRPDSKVRRIGRVVRLDVQCNYLHGLRRGLGMIAEEAVADGPLNYTPLRKVIKRFTGRSNICDREKTGAGQKGGRGDFLSSLPETVLQFFPNPDAQT
jgi:hypothetical protein